MDFVWWGELFADHGNCSYRALNTPPVKSDVKHAVSITDYLKQDMDGTESIWILIPILI